MNTLFCLETILHNIILDSKYICEPGLHHSKRGRYDGKWKRGTKCLPLSPHTLVGWPQCVFVIVNEAWRYLSTSILMQCQCLVHTSNHNVHILITIPHECGLSTYQYSVVKLNCCGIFSDVSEFWWRCHNVIRNPLVCHFWKRIIYQACIQTSYKGTCNIYTKLSTTVTII